MLGIVVDNCTLKNEWWGLFGHVCNTCHIVALKMHGNMLIMFYNYKTGFDKIITKNVLVRTDTLVTSSCNNNHRRYISSMACRSSCYCIGRLLILH